MDKALKIFCSVVSTAAGFMLGRPDELLFALIGFMCIDYLTGAICAFMSKNLSSRTGFHGLMKKMLILAMVSMGHIIDTQILNGGCVCRSSVIGFYIANEGISVMENAAIIGLPLPKKLKKVLIQIKEEK